MLELLNTLVEKGTVEYQWAYLQLAMAGRPQWESALLVALMVLSWPGFVAFVLVTVEHYITGPLMGEERLNA